MLPCKGTQMFMWARKSATECGICLPLRGRVGVFRVKGANLLGGRTGKEEGVRGLERTATANVGKLEGPDFMGFHNTVTKNAEKVSLNLD